LAAVLSGSDSSWGGNPIVCKGTSCKSYERTSERVWRPITDATAISCPNAYVVDGDTLRCGRDRIRLLGIDAPEIERCPRWRTCAPGDGQASKRSLIAAVRAGSVRYKPVTRDRYGRTVAVVRAGGVNLSCWQLQHDQAIYKPKWDTGHFVARECQ
jgi:endonuclease YncB( thermonuclease family)